MKSQRTAAVLYLVAALMFLFTAVVGFASGNGASAAFFILSMVFLILAFNARQSTNGSDHS